MVQNETDTLKPIKARILNQIPENTGSPTSPWATPMLKGFVIPLARPAPPAHTVMAIPTNASNPMERASITPRGTNARYASNVPIKVGTIENSRTITGIKKMSFPLLFFNSEFRAAWIAPVSLITLNAPPTIRIRKQIQLVA